MEELLKDLFVWTIGVIVALGSALGSSLGLGGAATTRMALTQTLPAMNGTTLKVSAVEVSYAPGESSAAHSHPCPVIGYVVDGAVTMKINDQPERTYRSGDGFFEAANGVHAVSANASKTVPAKLLAVFVCDRETPLSVDVPNGRGGRP